MFPKIESSVYLQTLGRVLIRLNEANENFLRSYETPNNQEQLFQAAILNLEYEISAFIRMEKLFQDGLIISSSSEDKEKILQSQNEIRIKIICTFHAFKYWADRKELAPNPVLGAYPPDDAHDPLLVPYGYFCLEEQDMAIQLIQEKCVTQDWPIFGTHRLRVCMILMQMLTQQMGDLEQIYENRDRTYTPKEIRWSLLELKEMIYPVDGQKLMKNKRFWYYPIRILGEMRKFGFTETNYRKAIQVMNNVWGLELEIQIKDHNLQQESAIFENRHTTRERWEMGGLTEEDWLRVQFILKSFCTLLLQSHLAA